MATLIFNNKAYGVDHAVKGTDYIHGYDATGKVIVSIDGLSDFSLVSYDGVYLSPAECLAEPCNNLKLCGGTVRTADDRLVPVGDPINLLDNSYWKYYDLVINQRGDTTYIDTAQYTIDRWKCPKNLEVFLTYPDGVTGGIELHCRAEATGFNGFTQILEHPPETGTVMTLAVKETNGTIHVGSAKWPNRDSSTAYNGAITVRDESDNIKWVGRLYGDRVSIMLNIEEDLTLEWVALYEGKYTAETLPEYRYKGYGVELAECQRYYLRYGRYLQVNGYTSTATLLYVALNAPVEMRTKPTMTSGDASFNLRVDNGADKVEDCPLGTYVYKIGNQLRFTINITDKGLSNAMVASAVLNTGYIEFSAEL